MHGRAIIAVYLHMDKLEVAKVIQWWATAKILELFQWRVMRYFQG
jgi:hypothetical protein